MKFTISNLMQILKESNIVIIIKLIYNTVGSHEGTKVYFLDMLHEKHLQIDTCCYR